MTPPGLTDFVVRVHTFRQRDFRTERRFRPLVHTIDTHMTVTLMREYLSDSIVKQATR